MEELEDVTVIVDFSAKTITLMGVWSVEDIDHIRPALFCAFGDDFWNDFDLRYQYIKDDTEQMYNWESNYS